MPLSLTCLASSVRPLSRYIRSTMVANSANITTDFVESVTLTAHCAGAHQGGEKPAFADASVASHQNRIPAALLLCPICVARCVLHPLRAPPLPTSSPADMCNDGIQNNNETGIDCGGPCPECQDLHLDELAERNADLAKDLAALRMKIAAEQKAKEERDQENKVAKVAISFMIVLGAAIVLGGPIIYALKRGRASGGVGPLYQQVEGGGSRKHPV